MRVGFGGGQQHRVGIHGRPAYYQARGRIPGIVFEEGEQAAGAQNAPYCPGAVSASRAGGFR